MNQTLETYLRTFVNFAQDSWRDALPSAKVAINSRDAASIGVDPFLLHGYNIDPLLVLYVYIIYTLTMIGINDRHNIGGNVDRLCSSSFDVDRDTMRLDHALSENPTLYHKIIIYSKVFS